MKKAIAIMGTVLAAAAGMFLPLLITFIMDTQSTAVYYDMTMLELPDETVETAHPEITAEDVIRAFRCCGDFHDVTETSSESMILSAEQAAAEAESFINTLCENNAIYLDSPDALTLERTRSIAYVASAKDIWGDMITSIREVYAPAWVCVFSCYEQDVYAVVDDYVGKVICICTEITDNLSIQLDNESYARYDRLLQCILDYYNEWEIDITDTGLDGYTSGLTVYCLYMDSHGAGNGADIMVYVYNKNIVFNVDAVPPDYILKQGDDSGGAVDDAANMARSMLTKTGA